MIEFSLDHAARASVIVYDVRGRELAGQEAPKQPRGRLQLRRCYVAEVGRVGKERFAALTRRGGGGGWCGERGQMGAPVVLPSKTPDRICTSSASRRWVVYLF